MTTRCPTPPEARDGPPVRAIHFAGLLLCLAAGCDDSRERPPLPSEADATADAARTPAADSRPDMTAVPRPDMTADRDAEQVAVDANRPPDAHLAVVLPSLTAIDPTTGDPLGGARLTVRGRDLGGAAVTVGGVGCAPLESPDTETVHCVAPALPPGLHDVEVASPAGRARLATAYEAWSPAQLPGARLFDARVGLTTAEEKTLYEWQRLTSEIAPDWRVRDGNTLTWLPSTERFWMVSGWNGYQEPEGFSHVDPDVGWPPQNTTDEVWSSPDGATWTLELAHEHGQFERRHLHNTMLWNDALWVIGGDTHQGYYNHDVLRSADGLAWEAILAPGEPPWAPRGMQISGVFDGALWTMGGQEMTGDPATMQFFNDVWRSEDGSSWTLVAPDAPASATRWDRCAGVGGVVEFRGEMWLVGCGCDTSGSNCGPGDLRAEVWSSADGATWTRHAAPPWAGKTWHDVAVWDDKLWILFGFTFGDPENGWPPGNANEAWFSRDGETWESLPHDAPVPGSHAQGVAVRDDGLYFAGGNYSFGFGAGHRDKSAWRLVAFRGVAVTGWTERGPDALTVAPPEAEARPVRVPDAFGPGEPGVQLDGSRSVLALDGIDEQAGGRTVLWVARAPDLPLPYGWEETYAPLGTVVGGLDATGLPNSSIGLSQGRLVMVNREAGTAPAGEPLWARVEAGEGLQAGPGVTRLVGLSHGVDGEVIGWVDGLPVPAVGAAAYPSPRSWSQLGGSLEGDYYGPNTRFAGTLGAVLVLPGVIDPPTAAKIHAWARVRFGAR